jgi:hypothetical protein
MVDLGNKAGQPNLPPTGCGYAPSHRHTWDGIEPESCGWSPIVWTSLKISEPIEAELGLIERDLLFAYAGLRHPQTSLACGPRPEQLRGEKPAVAIRTAPK